MSKTLSKKETLEALTDDLLHAVNEMLGDRFEFPHDFQIPMMSAPETPAECGKFYINDETVKIIIGNLKISGKRDDVTGQIDNLVLAKAVVGETCNVNHKLECLERVLGQDLKQIQFDKSQRRNKERIDVSLEGVNRLFGKKINIPNIDTPKSLKTHFKDSEGVNVDGEMDNDGRLILTRRVGHQTKTVLLDRNEDGEYVVSWASKASQEVALNTLQGLFSALQSENGLTFVVKAGGTSLEEGSVSGDITDPIEPKYRRRPETEEARNLLGLDNDRSIE